MIPLVASLIVILYLFIPAVLLRFAPNSVPLRNQGPENLDSFQKTKIQELVFVIKWSTVPFFLALVVVWKVLDWPLPTPESAHQRRESYKIVASSLISDKAFDDYRAQNLFWPSLTDVTRRQIRFLSWYYPFVGIETYLFLLLAKNYRKTEKRRWRDRIAEFVLLPDISEWHILLTDFAVPKQAAREVEIDVLTVDGILYQGKVGNYLLDSRGELSGIVLNHTYRFEREEYTLHQTADFDAYVSSGASGEIVHKFTRDKKSYWKQIPTAGAFYIPKERISNINIRHVITEPNVAPQAATRRLVARGITGFEIQEAPSKQPPAAPTATLSANSKAPETETGTDRPKSP
jgi:hypothetical protein